MRPARLAAALVVLPLLAAPPAADASRSRVDRARASRAPVAPAEAQPPTLLRDETVLVLPFTAPEAAEPAWLSAGLAALVAEGLRLVGYRTAEPETRDALLEELGLDRVTRLTTASACVAGREAGAKLVITGSWEGDESQGLRLTARVVDVERLQLQRETSAEGPLSAAGAVFGKLIAGVAGDAGREPAARRQLDLLLAAPSPALLAWMQAEAEPDVAGDHLVAALEASPSFPPALLALAELRVDEGQPEDVARLLAALPPSAAPSQLARGRLLEGRAHLGTGDVLAAVAKLDEAARLHPSRESFLWLAEAQLAAGNREGAAATARRVLELSPGDEHAIDIFDRAQAGPAPVPGS